MSKRQLLLVIDTHMLNPSIVSKAKDDYMNVVLLPYENGVIRVGC